MPLTPSQRTTLQERIDAADIAKRQFTVKNVGVKQGMWFDFTKGKWQKVRHPEPKWRRVWRKFLDWLDGGVE